LADLHGRVVAFLEARRAPELADLITRHHGVPLSAPCLREVHQPDAPELVVAVGQLCSDDVHIAIFLTGVGTATIFEAARRQGREPELLAALARKRVVVRGPKPVAVLRKAGVRLDLLAPPPHTTQELLAALAAWDLRGQRVAVQLYGAPNPEFLDALTARGAEVITLSPYAWDRPVDAEPVLRLIDALRAGSVDVLAGTSASQVDNFFDIAREHGHETAVRQALQRIPVAAQGPVCAAAFERNGIPITITPPTGHMGALVLAIADHFEGHGSMGAEGQRSGGVAGVMHDA
jgi:uroporphyrinogen-III synthase